MNKLRATIVFSLLMAIGSASLLLSSCSQKSMDGTIIFTQTSEKILYNTWDSADAWRYIPKTQIVAVNPTKPEGSIKVLSNDFFSAGSPEISYDGKNMLFSAQKKQNDPWQIYEMNLGDLKTRQIITSQENCTDPAYLPLGRMIFSKLTANDSLKSGHSLYTCNLDGSSLRRITFNPKTYLASSVLADGRILTLGRRIFPDKSASILMILRPDGTKADMFYTPAKDNFITSQGVETHDGTIVFIENEKSSPEKGNLISISYNRPLHSRICLSTGIEGGFNTVHALKNGMLLVSFRKNSSDRYSLYEFDQEKNTLGKLLYNNSGYDVLEAVEVGTHERPKKLPSEVDMGVKTGLLMCQDINFTDKLPGNGSAFPKASRIEILGIDSLLGAVNVAEDGSFYLKVMADKPFRIQTVDEKGKILSGPGDWIWLRPNERRGCVGCHQDPEMVPGNRVPLAVKKSPVVIPMHINKIVEKKVSLE
jgi:hypothetical protein